MEKRRLSFWEVWNLSFGFLGIQMGFALQNANASRIFQIFGAEIHELSWFWLVAPVMGAVVQPIIGHYSDKTWTRLGRRKPFFLVGALIAASGLVVMPNAGAVTTILPALWIGAGTLMVMDAAFNVAMEPFRALVADMMPADQRTLGFSVQTSLIGIGAVIGSWMPYALTNWFGISNESSIGEIPLNLILSFSIGAAVLVGSILVTILTTKEYTPEELASFNDIEADKPKEDGLLNIFSDFKKMPSTMKQLGLVQFFSWFGLFGMWVYSTPAITHHVYGLPLSDTSSKMYQDAGDWVGILFGVYNGISAIYAFFLPAIAKATSRKYTHTISLTLGGIGLISIYMVSNPLFLIGSMILIGIGWASILAMPYAMMVGSIPARKMGVYMGIFNLFIVIPQIVNGLLSGPMIKYLYGGNPVYILVSAGVAFIIAGILNLKVKDS
ncbi:MFS transporter [Reichenbachiella sp.]|uniref:MFS transporter n=1 Tax=Reichenbachiella sp. TaxID=2184521 RepID=UPI003BAE4833